MSASTHRRQLATVTVVMVLVAPVATGALAQPQSLPFDLTAALTHKLIAEEYLDEGKTIAVDAGERVVALPFPLAPLIRTEHEVTLEPKSIKFTVEPRKKARLVGFKPLPLKDKLPANLGEPETCIFERIVIGQRGGATRIEGMNHKHPPANADAAPRGRNADKSLRAPRQLLSTHDWLAMLVAVGPDANWVEVSVFKAPAERFDLLYLADADRPVTLANRTTVNQDVIKSTYVAATSDSPTMTALALTRIGRWRAAAGSVPGQVLDDLGSRLIQGLPHSDPRPRRAAWRALVAAPMSLRPADVAALRKAGRATSRACVDLVAMDLVSASPAARVNVLVALNAAWRNADGELSSKITALVLKDGGADMFDALDGATRDGLDEVFGRIKAETNPTLRAGLVRSLIGQTPVEREQALMAEARQSRLEITNPADGIFQRFKDANDPGQRMAILRALSIMPAQAVLHTDGFAGFVDFATSSKVDAAVRDGAYSMVISQAVADLPSRTAQPHGAYPVTTREGGQDGLSRGLAAALEKGPPDVQVEALAVMLRRGESTAAAKSLCGGKRSPDAMAALLGRVAPRPEIIQADGLFACLAASATAADRAATSTILRALDDAARRYPEATRWRLAAALRAGINWPAFVTLTTSKDTGISQYAMRWLGVAAHADGAAQAAVAKFTRSRDREAALAAYNARRAENVTGRYGCIVIIETIGPLDPVRFGQSSVTRWSSPRRLSLVGPIVTLQRREGGYDIATGGQKIGSGRPLRVESALPAATAWPMPLVHMSWKVPGIERDKQGMAVPFAPLAVVGGSVLSDGAEGALNAEAAVLIRSALTNADSTIRDDVMPAAPVTLPITLRPTGFGSFAGAGASNPPADSRGMRTQILNAVVILEPME